jgi:hypothetical protein
LGTALLERDMLPENALYPDYAIVLGSLLTHGASNGSSASNKDSEEGGTLNAHQSIGHRP